MRIFTKIFLICLVLVGWGRIVVHLSPHIILSFGGTAASVIVPLFVAFLIIKGVNRQWSFYLSWRSPCFIFCLYALISLLWAGNGDFFYFNTVLLPPLFAYVMFRDLLNREKDFWYQRFMPIFAVMPLATVLRGLLDCPAIFINEGKLDSPVDHHTLVAMSLLLVLPFVMERLMHCEKGKIYYGVCLVLNILGVIICGSRVGLVVLFLVLALGTFIFARRKVRIIGAAAIAVSILFLFAFPVTHQRFIGLLSIGDDPYMITRTRIWDMTFSFAKDHLLLGLGFSREAFLAEGIGRFGELHFFYEHPHNLLLQIFAFLGLVGLALFIWLCVDAGRKVLSIEKRGGESSLWAKALLVSLVGFFVMNLVEGALNSGRVMLSVGLALAMLDYSYDEEE